MIKNKSVQFLASVAAGGFLLSLVSTSSHANSIKTAAERRNFLIQCYKGIQRTYDQQMGWTSETDQMFKNQVVIYSFINGKPGALVFTPNQVFFFNFDGALPSGSFPRDIKPRLA